MSIADTLLPEFDQEMAATRRVLERVPSDKGEWRPHPKSFPLAHLAQLIAGMPGWFTMTIAQPELDLAKGSGYSVESTETLLAIFDRNVQEAHAAIATATDGVLAEPWSLKRSGTVLFTLPRAAVLRQHVSHLVHHRAQLGVYLRLLDVPVPSLYGPTADEPWQS